LCKPAVIDQKAEGFEADEALSDMGMAVNPTAEIFPAVVYMEGPDAVRTHQTVKLFHGSGISGFRPDIVSGCKHVTGVQAYTHALILFHAGQNFGEMLKPVPQAAPLACRGFEQDHNRRRDPPQSEIQRLRYAAKAALFPRSHMSPRVEDYRRDSQKLGPAHFCHEGLNRFLMQNCIR
jgi:hypothetical protein